SSATARDRDKLREQVLRGLGWEILRIWSTDWWVNPGGTLERVHLALQALLASERSVAAAATTATATAALAVSTDVVDATNEATNEATGEAANKVAN
ncbi:MAG: hypothetical protein KA309_05360, partial [Giesbergeria sp.]|nr:hypothetical protein [Giesbergeria sp.]